MYNILTLITYIFDLFILYTFLNQILVNKKENINPRIFWGCFILVEVLIFANEIATSGLSDNAAALITNLLSLFTTFGLTLLYNASMKHRIFVSLSFQVFATLGECLFTFMVRAINPSIFEADKYKLITIMNFGSKIVLYLFVLICTLFWKKRIRKLNTLPYNLLLFTTPFISLVIIIYYPLRNILDSGGVSFFVIVYIALTMLNIVNYILLERVFNMMEYKVKCNTLEQQIQYQQDKYTQLGTAYRSNRSIIHDMKKHYFAISEYIKNKEYDKLLSYMDIAINNLEANYASINTGNLVIDSFVSNFKKIAEYNHIVFTENISVDANKIPITDYDLCVILGNLLDNSFNACSRSSVPDRQIHLDIYSNTNDTFLIHTSNSYTPMPPGSGSYISTLDHGYGMENIRNIVEANHGVFQFSEKDLFEVALVIPVLDAKKRMHPPAKLNNY